MVEIVLDFLKYIFNFGRHTIYRLNQRLCILGRNYFLKYCSYFFNEYFKEGNVLFNNALNTFYLWLYGVRHMVKDHSDSERGIPLPPHGLLFFY